MTHTAHRSIVAALVAAAVVATGPTPRVRAGQHEAGTFRASVELVAVDVAVRRSGRPVAGLSNDDFEVLDNGIRQSIDRVVVEAVPLDAWLVLDVSSSLEGEPIGQLQKAASGFLAALTPGDRAALVTFSHQALVQEPLTSDLVRVNHAIAAMRAGGATALYDAAFAALQMRSTGGTRAVAVILTDGVDNSSRVSERRVVEAAEHSDVIVYGVAARASAGAAQPAPGAAAPNGASQPLSRSQPQYKFLQRLAEATGGRLLDASFATLTDTFTDVLRDIRARYVIAYHPGNPTPGWHTLKVRLARAQGEVTARRGYWVAPSPGRR